MSWADLQLVRACVPDACCQQDACCPKIYAAPRYMPPPDTCCPKIHAAPRYMLPPDTCRPQIHAAPGCMAAARYMLPAGNMLPQDACHHAQEADAPMHNLPVSALPQILPQLATAPTWAPTPCLLKQLMFTQLPGLCPVLPQTHPHLASTPPLLAS